MHTAARFAYVPPMKRVKFNFWDFLVAAILLTIGLSQGGLAILLAIIAFLLYMLVRTQFASGSKDTSSSSASFHAPDEPADLTASDDNEHIQKQLADAQMEVKNAMAEWRRYQTRYDEAVWAEAVEKVRHLEAKIAKREAR